MSYLLKVIGIQMSNIYLKSLKNYITILKTAFSPGDAV